MRPVVKDVATQVCTTETEASAKPDMHGLLYPLSAPQQAGWLDQMLTPHLPCYNVGVTVRLDGLVDLDRFETAIRHVAAHRDALRLVLVQHEDGAKQRFLARVDFSLRRFDFSMHADAQERAWAHMRGVFSTPFALYD